jgi:TetR/AcrR family transcriptional regulator, transcriptional repressor for nem operon
MARPKEFDREEALQKALYTFWDKGYEATTLPNLLESMKISRSSFYDTFGDKQTLFQEAMHLYHQQVGAERMKLLTRATSTKQGLIEYFNHHVEIALIDNYPGGCFVTNTATMLKTIDPKIVNSITQGTDCLEQSFYALLDKGQRNGEIAQSKDIKALSRLFLSLAYGINVVARVNPNRELLEDTVKAALSTLN